jgi:Transcriptional regulators
MNIYELAREAGVSIATVSRVINGKAVVSQKTREKVEAAMKKFDYTPSEIARGLVVNSMRTVGVMTIDIRDVYYANVAYTVEQELSKLGYTVILCNTGESTKEKIKYMNILRQKKVDGIILVGSVFKDESLDRSISLIAEKTPVVMINGFVKSDNVYSVICDDKSGIISAVDHLYASGRRRMIYLQDVDSFSGRAKVDGFKEGIAKNGLDTVSNIIIKVEKGLEAGYEGVQLLKDSGILFDAIVCGDDLTAVGAVKYLQDNNIKIPEEVAVTGYNNSILSRCCIPSLTTVNGRMVEMAKQAVEVFSKVMDGEKIPADNCISPELMKRKSSQ